MSRIQIYLDCDGVLADFDKRAEGILGMPPREFEDKYGSKTFWNMLYATPDFFTLMEPRPDAHELVRAVRHRNPIILTGIPRGYWAVAQKMMWRDKHFSDLPMITCPSADKYKFCRPGDVIVDDWAKYRSNWEEAGGIFILHISAADSIRQLQELGVI